MKKEILFIVVLAIIIVILWAIYIFAPSKKVQAPIVQGIEVTSPKPNDTVSSPLTITGKISGNGWSGFEGQVGTVQILDYKGNVLGQTFLMATTEWTSLPTDFKATLNFTANNSGPATLLFKNENASGDPARVRTFSVPVKIDANIKTMAVKVFFSNNDNTNDCSLVYGLDRQIPKTQAVARASLEELIKGPTAQEKQQGYSGALPLGTKVQSISVENGVAKVDFNSQLEEKVGGSCWVTAIRSQITKTLMQFPTVKSVVISINGRTQDILQP